MHTVLGNLTCSSFSGLYELPTKTYSAYNECVQLLTLRQLIFLERLTLPTTALFND